MKQIKFLVLFESIESILKFKFLKLNAEGGKNY